MDDVMVRERYELSKERLGVIMLEETVKEPYRDYFRKTAEFLLMLDEVQGTGTKQRLGECGYFDAGGGEPEAL